MSKTLVFFPRAKPLINISKCFDFPSLLSEENTISMCTSEVLKWMPSIHTKSYESTWTTSDESKFFDILYLLSFLRGKNRALRHFVRLRMFGQEIFRLGNATKILKHFVSRSRILIFLPRLYFGRYNPQECLDLLRKHGIVKSNDISFFCELLASSEVAKVVAITTLKDPQIYDLVSAANSLNLPTHLILDSWDNIGCSAAIPEITGDLILWSQQQLDEVKIYYPELAEKSQVLGTPRRLVSASVQEERKWHRDASVATNKSKFITILMVQAYFFDDTSAKLKNLEKILLEIIESHEFDFLIKVRAYPLKAPSHRFKFSVQEFIESRSNHRVQFFLSENAELRDDLVLSDIVISEISTGGLEAGLADIPTLFVYSNHSYLYMNGKKILDFKFAHDLVGKTPIFETQDLTGIRNTILAYISEIINKRNIHSQPLERVEQQSNWDYFASPFKEERFRMLLGERPKNFG